MDTESRLSKNKLYSHYKKLTKCTQDPSYYSDAKAAVADYTEVKDKLYQEFVDLGMGQWLRKPQELTMFK